MDYIYVFLGFILAAAMLFTFNKCDESRKYQVWIYFKNFEPIEVVLSSGELGQTTYPSITELLKSENMIHGDYFVYKKEEEWIEIPMREVTQIKMKKIGGKVTKESDCSFTEKAKILFRKIWTKK